MFRHFSFFITLILSINLVSVYAQEEKNCKVNLKISGERNDGKGNYETELTVTQRCYDFDEATLKKQLADDNWRYGEHDYQLIGSPSQKQDCAGYTFQKLFGLGPYWITSQEFYNKLILYFGKEIESRIDPFGWGDVNAGDVLVYRKGGGVNHIAYISEVITTMGVPTSVVIETKDGKEGVYKHKIGLISDGTDPLIVSYGDVWVYRIDPSSIRVAEVSRTCDCETSFNKLTASNYTGFIKIEATIDDSGIKGIYYEFDHDKGWTRWGEFTGTIDKNGKIEGMSRVINRTGSVPYEEEIITKGFVGKGKFTGKPNTLHIDFSGKDFSESFSGEQIGADERNK